MSSYYSLLLVGLDPDEPGSNRGSVNWTSEDLENRIYLVKGPYKLMALFTKVLFTKKGSMIGNSDYGTDLVDLITGNVADSKELQDLLLLYINEASEQVIALQQSEAYKNYFNQDELLSSVNLAELIINSTGTGFTAYVELITVAGNKIRTRIPTR